MEAPSPERWAQIEAVLDGALELAPRERTVFLEEACTGDAVLRAEVERLLRSCDVAQDFLEEPAAEFAAPLLTAVIFPDVPETSVRTHIGPYRMVREIGRGGMGVVYLAERDDDHYRKRVALKVVRREIDPDEHLIRRFVEERQILASLDHPNIARLLDGGVTADGLPFFAMEYVEGTPIDRYCDEHRLPIETRLALFRGVCEAVQYAHRNLVVHRDLKPSNILVTDGGEVKLLDFGIAKLLGPQAEEDGTITRTGARMMTPVYASPEQLRGEAVSTASDVYSLGVVLYGLLTGHRPFETLEGRPFDVERLALELEPERPSAAVLRGVARQVTGSTVARVSETRGASVERLHRRLKGDLDTIVLMALRKEPERRYGSAEQLGDDLRRHLAKLPVSARRDTPGYRARTFIRRHRVGVAASAIAVLLLLGVSIVTAVQGARIGRQAERIARERDKAERMSDFLVQMFEQSNPDQSRGNAITVREMLDSGAARIDRELTGQPEVRAQMMVAMGRAYLGLGLYDRAKPLLDSAVATRRRTPGGDGAETAASLFLLGYLLRDQGHFDDAEPLYREALAIRRRLFGDRHVDVVASLNGLAYLLRGRGDFDESAALYREALAAGRTLPKENDSLVATTLGGLATALRGLGDFEGAEPLFREALAKNRALHGNDHPHININLYNLATLLHEKGDIAGAEPLFREAVAIGRKVLGDRHPLHAVDLMGLAGVLRDKGDFMQAEVLYRQALGIQRDALPAGHTRVATTLIGLSRVLMDRGKASEAEPLLREALASRRRMLRDSHWQIAEAEIELGFCLSALRRMTEAESLLVGGYTALRAKRGEGDSHTRRALGYLIGHYERSGESAKASVYRARLGSS
ncbi:MAG: serine/threonine protein kinase [Gemmatimonadaceae bacterium]|nr:serine/threonine protein kinase [Gemmatimonadaceae bacterium]